MASSAGTHALQKALPGILGWSGLVWWLSFNYLFVYYNLMRPIAPQPAEGRIYPLNNHGYVAYISQSDENRLHLLELTAFGLFFSGALIDHLQRHHQDAEKFHVLAIKTLYEAAHPSTWLSLGTSLRREFSNMNASSVIGVFLDPKRISLHSHDTLSDCRARLAASVALNFAGRVRGSMSGDKFHLYVRRTEFWNSFSPHFHGRLIAAPSGTYVDGEFKMHLFCKIFLCIWFAGVAVIGGSMVTEQLNTGTFVHLFLPILLLLFGLFLVYWGKILGADDEPEITSFLKRTLNSE